jgi:antitoxin CcdA
MLNFDNAPKKATNLSLNSKVLAMAKELNINVSQTVDALLSHEIKRRYWERWGEINKNAIDAYNERVGSTGLPLAKYRTWGKSLDRRQDEN